MIGRKADKCNHQWEFIQRTYNPPPAETWELTNADRYTVNKAMFGFTVTTQRCTICKWISHTEQIGKV